MIIARAYAKINWALDILATRENGYHELDMLMQSVSLCDVLTFERTESSLTLETDGQPDPYAEKNLVMRAARLLKEKTGYPGGARMTLEKNIPSMAGMGGGSSDCAAAIRALNMLWNLNLSEENMLELGFLLGADVPFCLMGGLKRVKGLGEMLAGLKAPGQAHLLIVMPDGGLSTGAVFSEYDRRKREEPPVDMENVEQALLAGDYRLMDRYARNVLTGPAVSLSGAVSGAIDDMYKTGAVMARMSGSGSAVFGVFDSGEAAADARRCLNGKYAFCECAETVGAGAELEEHP